MSPCTPAEVRRSLTLLGSPRATTTPGWAVSPESDTASPVGLTSLPALGAKLGASLGATLGASLGATLGASLGVSLEATLGVSLGAEL